MTSRPRVLIVDDEPMNRELLRRLLRSEYELADAADAADAMKMLREGTDTIDMILCDHLMPGQTGAEFVTAVHDDWPDMPMMLLTGYDGDEAVMKVLEEGIVREVVGKPWRGKDLKASIALHLASAAAMSDK